MEISKRALRRHHRARLKANRVRDNYWGRDWSKMSERHLGLCINTPAICSCFMCRNIRRSGWVSGLEKITWQERKNLLEYKEGCEMSKVQEFVDQVKEDGLVAISEAIFKDHKGFKQNITPAQYCETLGEELGISAEEAAEELLQALNGSYDKVIGECEQCSAFLTENQEHVCS